MTIRLFSSRTKENCPRCATNCVNHGRPACCSVKFADCSDTYWRGNYVTARELLDDTVRRRKSAERAVLPPDPQPQQPVSRCRSGSPLAKATFTRGSTQDNGVQMHGDAPAPSVWRYPDSTSCHLPVAICTVKPRLETLDVDAIRRFMTAAPTFRFEHAPMGLTHVQRLKLMRNTAWP